MLTLMKQRLQKKLDEITPVTNVVAEGSSTLTTFGILYFKIKWNNVCNNVQCMYCNLIIGYGKIARLNRAERIPAGIARHNVL